MWWSKLGKKNMETERVKRDKVNSVIYRLRLQWSKVADADKK